MKTKFDIGEKVWVVRLTRDDWHNTGVACSFCNGTGRYNGHGCAARAGQNRMCVKGIIYNRDVLSKYEPVQYTIESIVIERDVGDVVLYSVEEVFDEFDEKVVYATYEDALEKANALN